jgi:hypothetical protein
MTDVAPPATGVWYDDDEVTDAALHRLRLQGGDIDAELIRGLVPVAGIAIEAYVDSETVIDGPPPAADYQYAIIHAVIWLYQAEMPSTDPYATTSTATLLRPLFDSVIPHRRARAGVA